MLSREMGAAGQAGKYRFAVKALATSIQDGDRSSGFRANPSLGHIEIRNPRAGSTKQGGSGRTSSEGGIGMDGLRNFIVGEFHPHTLLCLKFLAKGVHSRHQPQAL
jgi:hypothetical protein